MWGGSITREHLLQQTTLLAMLEPVRDGPKEHILALQAGRKSSLTLEQEREVVSNLAFLSSRSKNSKRVIAIGIEDHDGRGIVIRMAVNGGNRDISHLEAGLKQISGMLEQISRLGKVQSRHTVLIIDCLQSNRRHRTCKCCFGRLS